MSLHVGDLPEQSAFGLASRVLFDRLGLQAGGTALATWPLPDGGWGTLRHSRHRLQAAFHALREISAATGGELAIGAAARDKTGRGTIGADALWASLQVDDLDPRLADARVPLPTLRIRHGDTLLALWSLRRSLGPADVTRANQQLAEVLGADLAAADVGTLIRLPGMLAPGGEPVVLEDLHVASYLVADVLPSGVTFGARSAA
jgi:hypothetical protein